jgi:hypothetical protein
VCLLPVSTHSRLLYLGLILQSYTPANSIKAKQFPATTAVPNKQKPNQGKSKSEYHHVAIKDTVYRPLASKTDDGKDVTATTIVYGSRANPTSLALIGW